MSFGFSAVDFLTVIQLAIQAHKRFADAPNGFKELQNEIRGLSHVLLDLENWKGSDSAGKLSSGQHSRMKDALQNCDEVLQDCIKLAKKYSELEQPSRNFSERTRRIQKRLQWEPQDVEKLRSRLTAHVNVLNTLLSSLNRDVLIQVNDRVDKLNKQGDDDELRLLANWLAPVNFSDQYSDSISRRTKGTGKWLLMSEEYKRWRDGIERTLLCPGIPGAGKTIMSSIIVEDLLEHAKKSSNHVVVYAYCSYKRQHDQTFSNLIATLLRQFLLQRPAILNDIRELHQCHTKASSRPGENELRSLLYSTTETCTTVFIVIDALDECADEVRGKLLSELFELQEKSKIDVRFLATTRYMKNILDHFKDCTELEILANELDIGQSLGNQMRRLAPCVERNAKLQELIKTRIISAAEGMFLLAQLHFDSLIDKTTTKSIKLALDRMQIGSDALNNVYKNTVERIQAQQTGFRNLAHKVLSWITYAVRPLTVRELQHALAVSPGDTEIDEESIEDEELMVSACAGLVTVDSGKSNVIRFIHYTTQAYFEDAGKEWLPSAHFDIAGRCIAYLSLENFSFGTCSTLGQFDSLVTQNPFLEYAAQYWGQHVSYVEEKIIQNSESPLISFLMKQNNIDCAAQFRKAEEAPYYKYHIELMGQLHVTPLHLLAFFGLRKCFMLLLDNSHDPNERDELGRTPLSYAAIHGHERIAKLLLDRADVEADSKDANGQTPLSHAATKGHERIAKLLLDRVDVEADSKDANGRTPLSLAANFGNETVAKLLMDRYDTNVNSQDESGGTPLSMAAFMGHREVVELLLTNSDVNVNIQNAWGDTALFEAIEREAIFGEFEDVVQLLLTRDELDINLSGMSGETPLIFAINRGLESFVRLLLTREDLDINLSDKIGRTPLTLAVTHGRKEIATLLRERGAV